MEIKRWLTIILVSLSISVVTLQAQTLKKPRTFSTRGKIYSSKPEQNKQFMMKLTKVVDIIVKDGSYSSGASAEFKKTLTSYMKNFKHGDVMAAIFHIFKEAIEETNEDKKFWLQKLENMNDIAEAMGDYLKELNEKSLELEEGGSEGGSNGWGSDQNTGSDGSDGRVAVAVKDYTAVVQKSDKLLIAISRSNAGLRRTINLRPGRKIIRSKREAFVFKLNLKKYIARMNKIKEKLKNSYRAYSIKLKRLKQGLPGIKKRMEADAARILN